MRESGWTTGHDVGSCLLIALCSLPMFAAMWLVPDEQTLSGHGMSVSRFLSGALFFGIAALATAICSWWALSKEDVQKSGLWISLWELPCFKLFCFCDVPLILLSAFSVRVR